MDLLLYLFQLFLQMHPQYQEYHNLRGREFNLMMQLSSRYALGIGFKKSI
jgi:hypothetical protein